MSRFHTRLEPLCLISGRPGNSASIGALFDCKQGDEDGSESAEYVINDDFFVIVDSSLDASISNVKRVAMYRHFDGQEGRRDWRKDLVGCLQDWLRRFPNCVRKLTGSDSYMTGPVVVEDEIQQVARTLPVDML